MKHMLVLLSALTATTAFANGRGMRLVNETAVIDDIAVTPVNAGINPSFEAFTISARVMVGANACAAQGLSARLVAQPDFDGNRHVIAIVAGRQPEGLACPYNYDPVYTEVSTTVRGQAGLRSTTYLHNAYERDLTVSLERFMACDEPAICTREYNPQSCDYQGVNFQDQNFCMTAAKAKTFACIKGIPFDPNEMSCTSIAE